MSNLVEPKEHLRIVSQEINNSVDTETGEIINHEEKTHSYVAGSPGEFFQLYAAVIPILEEHCSAMEAKIFVSCFWYATKDNELALPGTFKRRIAAANKVSYQTVCNAITNLVKLKLLVRNGQATYRINPRYFWKSTSGQRKATLKFVLDVECPNC